MRIIANDVTPFRGPRVRIPPSPPVSRWYPALPHSAPQTTVSLSSQRLLWTALLAFVSTGCLAERHLVVETSPPGALVEMDWKVVGRTPLELVINHPGRRRLFITLEGYEPILRDVRFPKTRENSFPLDIFTELLNPLPKDHVEVVKLTLAPYQSAVDIDLTPVLERAELLRRAGPSGPRESESSQP